MSEWIGADGKELTEEYATAILKDWLTFARHGARSLTHLHAYAGINRDRLAKLSSANRKETPTPDELTSLSAATGYPADDLAVQASKFLHPQIIDGLLSTESPGECKITSRPALKAWLKDARTRGRSGPLTQGQLGARISKSQASVAAWENPDFNRIPRSKEVKSIAAACGVPEPMIAFDTRLFATDNDDRSDFQAASTLDEEILYTGRLLSRCARVSRHVERNAHVFRARYGGRGDDESTLRAIGNAHGVTRERIRQIVDKQLSFLPATTLRTECFDALATACLALESVAVSLAEARLRHLLGGNLSLQGASDYGRDVLGRPLPIQLVHIRNGDTIVIAGDLPLWFQAAITQSKTMIRHCGAAQLNLVWALTMRQHQDWIPPDQFRQVIAHAPGFDWIGDDEAWFWFGPEGSANRLIKRTIEILAFAKRPLDIEIIYGGLTRYSRSRDSDVSEEAGVWPPMGIVHKLLTKSPAVICQQGDDFRLSAEGSEFNAKHGVAESILGELRLRGGLASRSELHQALVVGKGMNPVSFSAALAHSPLLRQVDRSVFAIRGWPISAARLTEAQRRIGSVNGPRINFKEVDVTSNGDVSWVNVLSESSMSNRYAGVPSTALMHLPEGQYVADSTFLTLTEHRMVGLIPLVVANGGGVGTVYRTTVNARMFTAKVEIIGQNDSGDNEPE
ncbi:sigma factor-like helix-turn-helix DNA-binding protein [Lysobacter sp. Hz 25]|uniref:sigma factor-like helix-turn-helix DNA-binding protein n=1 Tax=Lysobacter sp. Hz 25 TaxID=3383698 RepID=UPI0038D4FB6F